LKNSRYRGVSADRYIILGALLATGAAAIGVTRAPLLVCGVIGATAIIALSFRYPRTAIGVWLAVVSLVPFWTRFGVGATPSVVLGALVLVGVLASPASRKTRFAAVDAALILATAIVMVYVAAGGLPFFLVSSFLLVAGSAYILGRVAYQSTQGTFAAIMVVVALWGVAEFVFDWHAFENWFPSADHHWNILQVRGNLTRSEAGMGHAIAYAAALALSLPFARELRRPGIAQLIIIAGICASLSRGPMLAMVLTLGLGAVALTSGSKRIRAILVVLVGMVVVGVLFDFLYSGDYSDEVVGSGDARSRQLEFAISLLNPLGPATGIGVSDGTLNITGMDVIDSTPLRFSVNFGWIIAILLLAPVWQSAVAFARGKAGPASIALLGQIPILLVTSLITQWQALFFFVAGMAMTEVLDKRRQPDKVMPPAGSEANSPRDRHAAQRKAWR
jgi:hypothetical protein